MKESNFNTKTHIVKTMKNKNLKVFYIKNKKKYVFFKIFLWVYILIINRLLIIYRLSAENNDIYHRLCHKKTIALYVKIYNFASQ